jgi:oxidase EvaA
MKNSDEISSQYSKQLKEYQSLVGQFVSAEIYPHRLESSFEGLNDWSLFNTLKEVQAWFSQKRSNADMQVVDIPLNEVKGWSIDKATGNVYHKSNDFFVVHGVRVTTSSRETAAGWDQPILEQVGYDGGILGLIRKKFKGVPHYLCEAKMEPGNYGKVQLSPSLQATYANLKKVHAGRRPHFAEYFEVPNNYKNFEVLFDAWLAEDGGRLHLKRNKGMLLEIPSDFDIELPNDNFIWLSLYQIKALLVEDAWINPHIRGILAHV